MHSWSHCFLTDVHQCVKCPVTHFWNTKKKKKLLPTVKCDISAFMTIPWGRHSPSPHSQLLFLGHFRSTESLPLSSPIIGLSVTSCSSLWPSGKLDFLLPLNQYFPTPMVKLKRSISPLVYISLQLGHLVVFSFIPAMWTPFLWNCELNK